MTTTYKPGRGETYETVSRRLYGNADAARRLKSANSGITDPFIGGETLVIPAPANSDPAPQTDGTTLRIDGRVFKSWTQVTIERSLDSVDTFSMEAPLDAARGDFAQAMRPFSYAPLQLSVDGEKLFTGTKVSTEPVVQPRSSSIRIGGYSRPGVLMDCSSPADSYPIEFAELTIEQIAQEVAAPFNIDVAGVKTGTAFEQVALEKGESPFAFLTKLCSKRNIVLGSTTSGDLELRKPEGKGQIVATLAEGEQPLVSVTPRYDEQRYYSAVSGIAPTHVGTPGETYTQANPFAEGVFRPLVIDANDTGPGGVKATVENKLGRVLAASVSVEAALAGWKTPGGVLWEPGQLVKLSAPSALLPSATLEVRRVRLVETGGARSCTLSLQIPGVLAGVIPSEAIWE